MTPDKLLSTLERFGLQNIREGNGNFHANCPFHEENRPSWGISLQEPHWHGCFACHAKGTLFDLLIRVGRYSEEKAKRVCKINESEHTFRPLGREKIVTLKISEEKLYPFTLKRPAVRYLRRRGIRKQTARLLGMLYHHRDQRVLFPWYFHDEIVGVTGRYIGDNEDTEDNAKTLPYFGSKKSNYLYLPNRQIGPGRFYLVEGEIDAAKVFDAGYKNVGAIGHGRFAKGQKQMLLESPAEEIVCFFDDDKTGRDLVEEVCTFYTRKKYISRVSYAQIRLDKPRKDKLDPAALLRREIRYVLEKQVIQYVNFPTF